MRSHETQKWCYCRRRLSWYFLIFHASVLIEKNWLFLKLCTHKKCKIATNLGPRFCSPVPPPPPGLKLMEKANGLKIKWKRFWQNSVSDFNDLAPNQYSGLTPLSALLHYSQLAEVGLTPKKGELSTASFTYFVHSPRHTRNLKIGMSKVRSSLKHCGKFQTHSTYVWNVWKFCIMM